MKARRNLAMVVMALAAVVALSIVPAAAYADAADSSATDAPEAGAVDSSTATTPASAGVLADDQANASQDTVADATATTAATEVAPEAAVDAGGTAGDNSVEDVSPQEQDLADAAGDGGALAAVAATGSDSQGSALAAMAAAGGDSQKAAEDGRLAAQDADGLEVGPWGPLEIAVAKNLIEGAICGVASGTFSWSTSSILKAMFGDSIGDDTQQKLDQILQELNQLNAAMGELQKTANSQQLDTILNNLSPTLTKLTPHDVLNELIKLDKSKAEDAKRRVQGELTTSLGNGKVDDIESLASVEGAFDNFTSELWQAMTNTWHVTIDGRPQDLTLMQIWYEHLRYKYQWEHQAYKEWAEFQGQCVSLLASSLALERASLQVRLEKIEDYNKTHEPSEVVDEGAVKNRLNDIQDFINQMAGYTGYVTVESADNPGLGLSRKYVDYPGLFSEKTWAEQYWMYKERPDYRYYWVPGHEILFYAQVNSQDVPQEVKDHGLTSPDLLKGVNVDWFDNETFIGNGYDAWPKDKFWRPITTYQNGKASLVSREQLRTIYQDYKDRHNEKHLYDIFIGEGEGNFLGLDDYNGSISSWWFVLNEGVSYKQHTFKADELSINVMKSGSPKTVERAILCWYHRGSTERSHQHHYIGLGVARVGPETYKPSPSNDAPNAMVEVQSTVEYDSAQAHWQPSHGHLTLGFDAEAHGGVGRVLMDGKELDPSSYTLKDGAIVLTQAFLSSLPHGQHELFLDTVGGGHTVVFVTSPDSAESEGTAATKAAQMPATGDASAPLAALLSVMALVSAYAALRVRRTYR